MDLTTIWLLMLIFLVAWGFWQVRKWAELADKSAKEYCQKHHLQWLSSPRSHYRLGWDNGINITGYYTLNYSADALTAKKGEVVIKNGRLEQIHHWA